MTISTICFQSCCRAALWLLLALPVLPVIAQEELPGKSDISQAIEAVKADSALTEDDRNKLTGDYEKALGFLSKRDQFEAERLAFAAARESARGEAAKIQAQLERDTAAYTGSPPAAAKNLSLEDLLGVITADQAELAALESRAASIAEARAGAASGIETLQSKVAGLKALKTRLGSATAPAPGDSSAAVAAKWLTATHQASVSAELARAEEELLSQPMRAELLTAEADKVVFDMRRMRDKIKVYDEIVNSLRQAQASAALSAAETAEQETADKHPQVQALAQANTELGAHISQRAATLEKVKAEAAIATEQALTYENDLKSIERKLDVLGMSEALGRVLREQQLRLPRPLYGRSDAVRSHELISDSSLRQLQYEDERRNLRRLNDYVSARITELAPEEADEVRDDITELARNRRDLVDKALETESAFLRALADLEFSSQRAKAAAEAYREFVSERLLWIRSASAFSLSTFKPLPEQLALLLSPTNWWGVVENLPAAIFGSALYPMLLLLVVGLAVLRRHLLKRLDATGDNVGNVENDRFNDTIQALLLTLLLALTWPLLVFSIGLALDNYPQDSDFGKSFGPSMLLISYYYLGLEFLRLMLLQKGVVRRHFLWGQNTVREMFQHMAALQLFFLPSAFLGILQNRASGLEVQPVLASLLIVVALLALARFFYRMPNFMHGHLDNFLQLRNTQRRYLLGRTLRYFLTIVPLALVLSIVLGYTHTATQFLVLLLFTNGLFALLLLIHEVAVRWLRIMRLRLIAADRKAAMEAARQALENPDDELPHEEFEIPQPEALDLEGRKLLNGLLGLGAVLGTYLVWRDVLPALGILSSIELWQTTRIIDGVSTQGAVTVADIAQGLLIGFVGYVVVQRVPALLEMFLRQKMDLPAGTVYAGVTLFRYVLITIFVIMVLGIIGASWGQIQWAVAALSVGIGFGLQEIVANFISGLILLFEQPIRVGDTVTVGETSGVVTKIRMRATTIRDWDGRELLVPNKEFITGRLLNWSLSDKQTRFTVKVGVAYGSDLSIAMKLALEAAQEHPEVMADPAPFITFDEFGDNSLLLALRCYLPSVENRLSVSSAIRLAINAKYNEAGIVVAFPQRDVHLDTSSPLAVHVKTLDGLASE